MPEPFANEYIGQWICIRTNQGRKIAGVLAEIDLVLGSLKLQQAYEIVTNPDVPVPSFLPVDDQTVEGHQIEELELLGKDAPAAVPEQQPSSQHTSTPSTVAAGPSFAAALEHTSTAPSQMLLTPEILQQLPPTVVASLAEQLQMLLLQQAAPSVPQPEPKPVASFLDSLPPLKMPAALPGPLKIAPASSLPFTGFMSARAPLSQLTNSLSAATQPLSAIAHNGAALFDPLPLHMQQPIKPPQSATARMQSAAAWPVSTAGIGASSLDPAVLPAMPASPMLTPIGTPLARHKGPASWEELFAGSSTSSINGYFLQPPAINAGRPTVKTPKQQQRSSSTSSSSDASLAEACQQVLLAALQQQQQQQQEQRRQQEQQQQQQQTLLAALALLLQQGSASAQGPTLGDLCQAIQAIQQQEQQQQLLPVPLLLQHQHLPAMSPVHANNIRASFDVQPDSHRKPLSAVPVQHTPSGTRGLSRQQQRQLQDLDELVAAQVLAFEAAGITMDLPERQHAAEQACRQLLQLHLPAAEMVKHLEAWAEVKLLTPEEVKLHKGRATGQGSSETPEDAENQRPANSQQPRNQQGEHGSALKPHIQLLGSHSSSRRASNCSSISDASIGPQPMKLVSQAPGENQPRGRPSATASTTPWKHEDSPDRVGPSTRSLPDDEASLLNLLATLAAESASVGLNTTTRALLRGGAGSRSLNLPGPSPIRGTPARHTTSGIATAAKDTPAGSAAKAGPTLAVKVVDLRGLVAAPADAAAAAGTAAARVPGTPVASSAPDVAAADTLLSSSTTAAESAIGTSSSSDAQGVSGAATAAESAEGAAVAKGEGRQSSDEVVTLAMPVAACLLGSSSASSLAAAGACSRSRRSSSMSSSSNASHTKTFASLGLPAPLVQGLYDCGYKVPEQMQAVLLQELAAACAVPAGEQQAEPSVTCFHIPSVPYVSAAVCAHLLHQVDLSRQPWQADSSSTAAATAATPSGAAGAAGRPTALLVCPTRAEAGDMGDLLRAMGHHMQVQFQMLVGGTRLMLSEDVGTTGAACNAPMIVVATPGRVLDVLRRGKLDINVLRQLVLMETAALMTREFRQQIQELLQYLAPYLQQVLLLSPTELPNGSLAVFERLPALAARPTPLSHIGWGRTPGGPASSPSSLNWTPMRRDISELIPERSNAPIPTASAALSAAAAACAVAVSPPPSATARAAAAAAAAALEPSVHTPVSASRLNPLAKAFGPLPAAAAATAATAVQIPAGFQGRSDSSSEEAVAVAMDPVAAVAAAVAGEEEANEASSPIANSINSLSNLTAQFDLCA